MSFNITGGRHIIGNCQFPLGWLRRCINDVHNIFLHHLSTTRVLLMTPRRLPSSLSSLWLTIAATCSLPKILKWISLTPNELWPPSMPLLGSTRRKHTPLVRSHPWRLSPLPTTTRLPFCICWVRRRYASLFHHRRLYWPECQSRRYDFRQASGPKCRRTWTSLYDILVAFRIYCNSLQPIVVKRCSIFRIDAPLVPLPRAQQRTTVWSQSSSRRFRCPCAALRMKWKHESECIWRIDESRLIVIHIDGFETKRKPMACVIWGKDTE